jgi:saccharopine dehydrogenase (NAD+, L-lysine forming)
MLAIGLIREGKVPADNRVALTPAQCKWLCEHINGINIIVQPSDNRCFSNKEYEAAGVEVKEDLSACNLLLGIKEVPVSMLIDGKQYMFFSHTRKKQLYNQKLMHAMVQKKITLIDYESLVHEDGQRIIGFGFFAGIVGAHNGMMAYGNRTGAFNLGRVGASRDYLELIHTYFGLKLPNLKIAVTGNGRVAHGILEIMNLMDVREVEPKEFLMQEYTYPVYVHLKGSDLYMQKETGNYFREDFREHPNNYVCIFEPYCYQADILMNGIFWDTDMPRLFNMETLQHPEFRIKTIADVTDDAHGSVPCNLGDGTIDDPVYGVDRMTAEKTAPYLPGSIDVMAVGNLPNELPKDASRYFGEQLIKYVLEDLMKGGSKTLNKATILSDGKLTEHFEYLSDYAY